MVRPLCVGRILGRHRLSNLSLVQELGLELFLERDTRRQEYHKDSERKPDVDTHC